MSPPQPQGDASWTKVESPGTRHYQLALGELSSGADPINRAAPTYPPTLLNACPAPVHVQATLIVDEAGKVSAVRVTNEAQATVDRHRFINAVRSAARQWTFEPLQIERWAADANGDSHEVDSQTKPFSLNYLFSFSCSAGKGQVSRGAVGAGG